MSRHHQQGGEPSQRMLRVGELIRHALSDLLSRGTVNDPVLEGHVVTVPDVKMSPDLKLATAYVMPLGGQDERPVIEALERNKKVLRQEVARRVALKFAPDLHFQPDTALDYAMQIDRALRQPEVARDLAPRPEEEE